ncbi:MAG TPA: DUF881 domain-containing protein [Acidimicrobiales bacterium]|nr:DUF881 domain-containing protein [Acidimicrobiales bacterium]
MHRRASLALAGVFVVLGFLVVTSAQTTRVGLKAAEPRKAQLISLIQQRRSQVADLDQAVRQLRSDTVAAQHEATEQGQQDKEEARRVQQLSELAGTTALKGRGLVVKLSDSDKATSSVQNPGAYRIHDTDIQLVVNALFDAGAEAVSVNGSRLVATTPIRAAGGTIVVNFRPLTPPYTVNAIGADKNAFQKSDIVKRFGRWEKLFGLGFKVKAQTVTVPSYTGRVAISTAQPVGTGGSP